MHDTKRLISFTFAAVAALAVGCGDDGPAAADEDTATTDTGAQTTAPPDVAGVDAGDIAADATACTPGEPYCISTTEAAVCDTDGDGPASTTPCTGASVCAPTTGTCAATICPPDALNCLDLREYQVCAPDGSGYGEVMRCEEGTFCADGACRVCQADAVECLSDETYRQCASDSSGWSTELTCPDDHRCVNDRCRRCDLVQTCDGPLEARQYCASDEITYDETTTCTGSQTCTDGRCFACEADERVCIDETSFRVCGSDGATWGPVTECGVGETCLDDACVAYQCAPRILLLVDKSGSMGTHWDAVRRSIEDLVELNPTVRFGLMTFPTGGWSCDVAGSLQVDFVADASATFSHWFETNSPNGLTPLAAGLGTVLEHADAYFQGFGGALVVLSDGHDTCFSGDIRVEYATTASTLFLEHDVATYAIGYAFSGDASELDVIADNGGTGREGHIAAGDETALSEAFQIIVDDVKVCEDPGTVD